MMRAMSDSARRELAATLKTNWEYYKSVNDDITQKEFAEKLGYTQSFLSQMINGHLEVPFRQAWQLSKAFGLDFKQITERYYNGKNS